MVNVRTAGELGYCFGVNQAIEKAIRYADEHGGRLYTLGTLAHNEHVVEYLRSHGVGPAGFNSMGELWALEGVRLGGQVNVAITAHGAPPQLYKKLTNLNVLDCTCPIVRKAQEVVSQRLDDFDILIFGDPNHQEVIGLVGWAEDKVRFVGKFNDLFTAGQDFKSLNLGKKVAVISQTTNVPSMFADFVTAFLNRHIEQIEEFRVINTICPIVAARVNETRKLAKKVDMMLVVGSKGSANTRNLETICRQSKVPRYPGPWTDLTVRPSDVALVQDEGQVEDAILPWFQRANITDDKGDVVQEFPSGPDLTGKDLPDIGVTGGTSTPIEVVERVVTKVKELLQD